MTLLPDDTGHHIVQSRTGGDALTELPYQRTGPIIEGLSEKHQMKFGNTVGPGGNLPAEMSLSNYAHKADDRATGLERQSGIGKNPDKSTTAHPRGTAGQANLKGVDLTSDAAIRANLDAKVAQQIADARTAAATDAPRQAAVREIIPGAYQGNVDDIAQARSLITPKNTPNILNTYRQLIRGRQFGMNIFTEYATAIDEITGGHIDKGIQHGVNWLRKQVGLGPNPIRNNYAP